VGENNSPARFGCWARRILAQKGNISFLGRDRPNPFWAEIGPTPFGLSPAQLVGPDQPSPFNIVYYIYYILYYLYIYIYIYEKIIKILQKKLFKKICDFVVILLLYFD
jgi:hypothetical protein